MVELFRDFKVNERHITVTFNVSEYDNDNEIEGIFYHEELVTYLYMNIFQIRIQQGQIQIVKKITDDRSYKLKEFLIKLNILNHSN